MNKTRKYTESREQERGRGEVEKGGVKGTLKVEVQGGGRRREGSPNKGTTKINRGKQGT